MASKNAANCCGTTAFPRACRRCLSFRRRCRRGPSSRLRADDYRRLMACRTMTELAAALKEYPLYSEALAEVNPQAVVDTLPGLGHMGLLGDPASVRASLQRHWARVIA